MSIYDTLNPMQQEAVRCTEGPLLILAGAGSGKTRVLTHRAAYLIGERHVNPWNIMAITFTNKAAGEMRERVDKLVGLGSESIWVSTFHSTCVRILRRFIEALGYGKNFSIYDSDDQRTLMKQVFHLLNVEPKQFKERQVLGVISHAKDQLIGPEEFLLNAGSDFRLKKTGEIYQEYQRQLKRNNALDFDDLIVKTVELFRTNPQILEYYQDRFRYIMVDEYQDTNMAQFQLVKLLAAKYRNLCVVGDDDQSIYRFRGADIRNILSFEESFPGAKVVKLEQNYRSTQNILDAANEVIRNNQGRKEKRLWTANETGAPVRFYQFDTAREEADFVLSQIRKSDFSLKDQAVLYRTNAQSRLFEERCIFYNIPYRLVGGVNFYQRREIKDVLAYLKIIANGEDDLATLRVINVPKRGIGAASMNKVTVFASVNQLSLYEALEDAKMVPGLGKAVGKIEGFVKQIEALRAMAGPGGCSIKDLIEGVLEQTGYAKELEQEGEEEAKERLANIGELLNKAAAFEAESGSRSLDEFLEQVALVADVDSLNQSEERVTLMTLHSAKGLEFPKVYLAGMEEELFPSAMAVFSPDPTDLEEERRLCYVGITRAQKELVLTAARKRMVNGETRWHAVSRFVDELPQEQAELEFFDPLAAYKQEKREIKEAADTAPKALPWNQSPKPSFGKTFTVEKQDHLDYEEGDRVSHQKFGTGTVAEIKDGGKDFEVTVDFDRAGRKKMFASFAKLKKI